MNFRTWKRIIRAEYGVPVGLCILLQGLLMAVISPLQPIVISERIGMDKQEVTAYFLIITFVGTVVTLGTGYLSDGAIARHKLALVSGLIGSLGIVGIAAATRPIHAYLAGAISVAVGVLFPQLFAVARTRILADWEQEAKVVGITALRTLFSFGFILGTGLASLLARGTDIQAAFYLVGGAFIALTVYAAIVLYRIEGTIAQRVIRPANGQSPDTASVILPIYALVAPLIALMLLQGAQSTRHLFLPLVIFERFNDASIAPLMFGITATIELVTMGLLGSLASKIGEKMTIAIGALTGAVYFFMLAFIESLPILYLSNVVCAVCVAAIYGVGMAYIQRLLAHRAGMGGSLFMGMLNIGSLIGILSPLLVAGYDPMIFVLPAILCIAGAAVLVIGDRTAQIERRLRADTVPGNAKQDVIIAAPIVIDSEV